MLSKLKMQVVALVVYFNYYMSVLFGKGNNKGSGNVTTTTPIVDKGGGVKGLKGLSHLPHIPQLSLNFNTKQLVQQGLPSLEKRIKLRNKRKKRNKVK